jgi:hypothetical protein
VEEELRKGGHIIRKSLLVLLVMGIKKLNESQTTFKYLGMGDGFDRYSVEGSQDSSHEAGYDAYMTGVIYLGFVHYIKEKEGKLLEGWMTEG